VITIRTLANIGRNAYFSHGIGTFSSFEISIFIPPYERKKKRKKKKDSRINRAMIEIMHARQL